LATSLTSQLNNRGPFLHWLTLLDQHSKGEDNIGETRRGYYLTLLDQHSKGENRRRERIKRRLVNS
jgi:hypothetical protein